MAVCEGSVALILYYKTLFVLSAFKTNLVQARYIVQCLKLDEADMEPGLT